MVSSCSFFLDLMKITSSAGLQSISQQIKGQAGNCILDLGEMRAGTFRYFSSLSTKIRFENLTDLLNAHIDQSEYMFREEVDRYLEIEKHNAIYDAVLLWDIANFIGVEDFQYLVNKISRFCKKNTPFFFVTYIGSNRPKYPSRFQINSQGDIEIESSGTDTEKNVKLTTVKLLKNLPNFLIDQHLANSLNIDSQMSESVIRFMPDASNLDRVTVKKNISSISSVAKKLPSFDVVKNPKNTCLSQMVGEETNALSLCLGHIDKDAVYKLASAYQKLYKDDLTRYMRFSKSGSKITVTSQLAKYDQNLTFSTIFIWDLVNYLDKESLAILWARLRSALNPGSRIYLIVYIGSIKPARPQRFLLSHDYTIGIEAKSDFVKNELPLNSYQLLKRFPGTRISAQKRMNEDLLKNCCEYVLEYTG